MKQIPLILPDFTSLTAALCHWAEKKPDATALTYLKAENAITLSYAQLQARALEVAHDLRLVCDRGDRVLLGFEQGTDYIAGFLGCVYASVIAVTSAPPDELRRASRLSALLADSGARVILVNDESAWKFETVLPEGGPRLTNTNALSGKSLPEPQHAAPEDLVLLQYTSGSTSAPKGVMLTHDSLVANLKAIMADIRPHSESVYVSWLPLYHDMGLIFMTLAGLFAGRPIYLMAPAEFLRHPDRWLRAISTYGGTITAAPNFAYRLCVERVNNAQLRELDLSRMECLLNGSEPVRVEDMEAFLERFAPAGLKKKAIHGGYGMAELGVYASSGPILTGHHPFDPAALENRGQVVPLAGRDPGARLIAPCGVVNPEHLDLRIVDMQTGCECAPQHVGEIWLAGPSVGKGYWNNAEATEATFGNRLPGRSKTYLRTGDKGFVYDGRIYICGRLKEIIILRGRNIFPNDVCALIESNVAEMRGRRAAAFGIPGDSGEELVVVSAARVSEASWRKVARQITAVLGAEMGIIPFDIVFVPNRALSRTTSGKVQHGALRQAYLEGRLEYEFAFTGPISHVATIAVSDAADADDDDAAAGAPDWMVQRIRALCSFICNRETLEDDANLFELGLDSLRAVQLLGALESDLMGGACSITIPEIVELKTPRNIAAALARAVQQNHASRSGFKEVLL